MCTPTQLAGTLLPIFDPLLMAPVKGEQDQDLIPSFHQPVIRSGLLPGGFHYLHVEKPNTGESLAVMAARDDYVSIYMYIYVMYVQKHTGMYVYMFIHNYIVFMYTCT